jgi:hypothetical protein
MKKRLQRNSMKSVANDPMGSWTGTVAGAPNETPVQDADDL